MLSPYSLQPASSSLSSSLLAFLLVQSAHVQSAHVNSHGASVRTETRAGGASTCVCAPTDSRVTRSRVTLPVICTVQGNKCECVSSGLTCVCLRWFHLHTLPKLSVKVSTFFERLGTRLAYTKWDVGPSTAFCNIHWRMRLQHLRVAITMSPLGTNTHVSIVCHTRVNLMHVFLTLPMMSLQAGLRLTFIPLTKSD